MRGTGTRSSAVNPRAHAGSQRFRNRQWNQTPTLRPHAWIRTSTPLARRATCSHTPRSPPRSSRPCRLDGLRVVHGGSRTHTTIPEINDQRGAIVMPIRRRRRRRKSRDPWKHPSHPYARTVDPRHFPDRQLRCRCGIRSKYVEYHTDAQHPLWARCRTCRLRWPVWIEKPREKRSEESAADTGPSADATNRPRPSHEKRGTEENQQ